MAKSQVASVTSYRNPKLISIPDVEIDKSGKFKYILIKVHDPEIDREFKHIVRGSSKNGYIDDLLNNVFQVMDEKNLDCEVVGGGYLEHEPAKKSIKIYGRSPKYGQADHSVTQAILLLKFKDYDQITYNQDKM